MDCNVFRSAMWDLAPNTQCLITALWGQPYLNHPTSRLQFSHILFSPSSGLSWTNIKDFSQNTLSAHYVKGILYVSLKLLHILERSIWLISIVQIHSTPSQRTPWCLWEWPVGHIAIEKNGLENFVDIQQDNSVLLIIIQVPPYVDLPDMQEAQLNLDFK